MSIIETVKERLDIVDVIGEQIALRKAGRNFVGFCPFHSNTRTPALTVFPETQSYHCFSCKKSGDVFTFMMEREGLAFGDALEQLAGRAGVQLRQRTEREESEDAARTRLYEINAQAATFYAHALRTSARGAAARAYVAERGLSDITVEAFQLGYAPADWSARLSFLSERGFEPAEAEAAGLAIRREDGGYHDRFRDRLLFPIHDGKGRVCGFGGRLLGDGHPKYLNSPQTAVFDKGRLLYGLHQGREAIRRDDAVVIVEGYVDVLMAHQHGFRNVVAPMGTALSETHVRMLSKLTKRLLLALDADAAGQSATLRSIQTLQESLDTRAVPVATAEGLRWERELDAELRVLALPLGRDPDEVIRESPAAWSKAIADSQPLMAFYLTALTAGLDLRSAKGKAAAVERLAPLLRQVSNRVEQAHYVQQLAALIDMDETVVRGEVQSRRGYGPASAPRPTSAPSTDNERERYLLALLLQYPAYRDALEQQLAADLAQLPQIQPLFHGTIAELFSRTEYREIWTAFAQALEHGATNDGLWATELPPELLDELQALSALLNTPDQPELQPFKVRGVLLETAHPLRLRLAKRWNTRIAQLVQSATPEEQLEWLARHQELLSYLNTLSLPPRSSYFRDTRDAVST